MDDREVVVVERGADARPRGLLRVLAAAAEQQREDEEGEETEEGRAHPATL